MELICEEKKVKMNIHFFVYFLLMFCFYTNTIIQLFAQIYILTCIASNVILYKKGKITQVSNIKFYLLWYGLFVLVAFLSQNWAYGHNPGSKVLITLFRIFVIGLVLVYYGNTRERLLSLLLSYIYACACMGGVAIVTTLISGGQIGTVTFGLVIGQHRNQIGAVAAPLAFICFCLKQAYDFKSGKNLFLFFTILTICTGSRTSILQLASLFLLSVIMEKNLNKKVKGFLFYFALGIGTLLLFSQVPFLHDNILVRVENAFFTVFSDGDTFDNSALGRSLYKQIAFMMFLERPLLGHGVDGFFLFLKDNPTIIPGIHLQPVYSHCNYAEIAADFGLLGLIIWYLPMLKILHLSFIQRTKGIMGKCLFCIFLTFLISDYSRFPWDTHLIMYMYICIIMMILQEKRGLNAK